MRKRRQSSPAHESNRDAYVPHVPSDSALRYCGSYFPLPTAIWVNFSVTHCPDAPFMSGSDGHDPLIHDSTRISGRSGNKFRLLAPVNGSREMTRSLIRSVSISFNPDRVLTSLPTVKQHAEPGENISPMIAPFSPSHFSPPEQAPGTTMSSNGGPELWPHCSCRRHDNLVLITLRQGSFLFHLKFTKAFEVLE